MKPGVTKQENISDIPLDAGNVIDYRMVLDQFADAVVAANGSGSIMYVNAAAEHLLGWGAGELSGQPLTSLMPERMRPLHNEGFLRFKTTRRPRIIGRPVRVPALRKDGVELDVELTLSAYPVANGGDLFIAAIRDLRERVELERQLTVTHYLRQATEMASSLASHLESGAVVTTVVRTLVDGFDSALARVWLHDPVNNVLELKASAGLSEAVADSSRARIDLASYPFKLGKVARTRQSFISNQLADDPEFDQAWVEREKIRSVAILPLLHGPDFFGLLGCFFRQPLEQEVAGVLEALAALVATSIYDVRLFERAELARQEAQRANEVKTTFLRLVSHELRTPLTTLQLHLHLLSRAKERSPSRPHLDHVRVMRRASHRLAELIDSLLEYARIESGQLQVNPQPLELLKLVAEVVDELRAQADQKGISLSVQGDDIPPLVTDERLVTLAVTNLVENAVKYTNEGSVQVDVAFARELHSIRVTDTGPGIPEASYTQVFEPFTQLEKVDQKHIYGVGLGLALVKEIVAALDGHVELRSELGRGTQITIWLPSLPLAIEPPRAPTE